MSLSWQELLVAAAVDPLTGVTTRPMLLDRLETDLGAGAGLGLLYLDLVGLKAVNDTRGHAAGDAVLREAGARLRAAVRRGDLVARMGGDEFAVLVSAGGPTETEAVAERIRAALAAPHGWGGHALRCPASIGWTVAEPSAPQSDRAADLAAALLDRADRAMYADRGVAHAVAPGPTGEGPLVAHDVGSVWSLADLLAARPDAAVLDTSLLQQALADETARRALERFVGLLIDLRVQVSVQEPADDACRLLAAQIGVGGSEPRTGISHAET